MELLRYWILYLFWISSWFWCYQNIFSARSRDWYQDSNGTQHDTAHLLVKGVWATLEKIWKVYPARNTAVVSMIPTMFLSMICLVPYGGCTTGKQAVPPNISINHAGKAARKIKEFIVVTMTLLIRSSCCYQLFPIKNNRNIMLF